MLHSTPSSGLKRLQQLVDSRVPEHATGPFKRLEVISVVISVIICSPIHSLILQKVLSATAVFKYTRSACHQMLQIGKIAQGDNVNQLYAFHTCSRDSAKSIIYNDFQSELSQRGANGLGSSYVPLYTSDICFICTGNNFSLDPTYCTLSGIRAVPDPSDITVLLCSIIVGDSAPGEYNRRRPPLRGNGCYEYDSFTGNLSFPLHSPLHSRSIPVS